MRERGKPISVQLKQNSEKNPEQSELFGINAIHIYFMLRNNTITVNEFIG